MARYFLKVSYMGGRYAGFQEQANANSIQAEVHKALKIYFRREFELTGSSRTDTGVHARVNYLHFDADLDTNWQNAVYHLNAILPDDIVLLEILPVADDAHCRFDAISRSYEYSIYRKKDPFLNDRAYYFPYKLDFDLLNAAAAVIPRYENFETFSKRNTQVNHFNCKISESEWQIRTSNHWVYRVKGNRFLRGMVRGLVGTMLRVGTGKISKQEFEEIIQSGDVARADFSVPGHGLQLTDVAYPANIFLAR